MKILHVIYSTSGGAGIAVLRLHRALLAQGVESRVLTANSAFTGDDIIRVSETGRKRYVVPRIPIIDKWIRLLRRKGYCLTEFEKLEREELRLDKLYPAYFDMPISNYELENHPLIEWADIVHIHWISGFVNFPTFFAKIKKPIVWTMHDLNPFYGGFHHYRLREKYLEKYRDLENLCMEIKHDAITQTDNVSLVAISSRMHQLMTEHETYKNKQIFDIHNCIDPMQFPILNKQFIREALGWGKNKRVFIFVNKNMNDSEKGLMELVAALDQLCLADTMLVCVGDGALPQSSNVEMMHYRSVNDTIWLAMLYAAADYLAFPSKQEAFPSTPLEAMLCGTPVVMTPVSGAVDMMTDQTGVIADGYEPQNLAKAIMELLNKQYDSVQLRQHVVENFGPAVIAKSHIDMYNQLMQSK